MGTLDRWNATRNTKIPTSDSAALGVAGVRVPLHLQNSAALTNALPSKQIAGMKNEFANNLPPNPLDGFGNQLPGGHELSALQEKLARSYGSSPQDMSMRLVVTRLFEGVSNNTQPVNAVKTIADNFESLRNDPAFAPLVNRLFAKTEQTTPTTDKSMPLLLAGIANLQKNAPTTQDQLYRIINSGQIAKLDEHTPNIPHYLNAANLNQATGATEKTASPSQNDPHQDLRNFIAEAQQQPADQSLTNIAKPPAHRLT